MFFGQALVASGSHTRDMKIRRRSGIGLARIKSSTFARTGCGLGMTKMCSPEPIKALLRDHNDLRAIRLDTLTRLLRLQERDAARANNYFTASDADPTWFCLKARP